MSDRTPLGPLPDPDGDGELSPTARRLREALAARAAGVHPTDRLEEIHVTSRADRRRSRTRAVVAAAGVAAVVVVGGGGYALAQRDGGSVRTVAGSPAAAPASSTTTTAAGAGTPGATAPAAAPAPATASGSTGPATAATSAPATSTPTGAAAPALPTGAARVPVYWTGGGKLFREFTPVPGGRDDATNALQVLLGGTAADADYRTSWGVDPAAEVTRDGSGAYVVDVSAAAVSTPLSAPEAELAVQQLVHTVTAAGGGSAPVRLLVDGREGATVFGSHRVPAAVERAPQVDVQAPAWITQVTPGAGSVTVAGVGTAFEGTLLCTLTDAAGVEVAREPVQAGANGTFGEFSLAVAAPAGTYTVAVFAPDESGGEGPVAVGDTKTVTVR
ncbi:Gmad2 immunoglobulin-like domain-containing protein [Kineococcus radiotolerans]|uniref:GerMN domain-containing protein n=1 Tax=Kineococcus radiotolerans (strain ATCC BAA-149 / DSM 14245 / SRS30216) TaxID=266940 RepID=A6WDH6_KINRD|nr:Gmad2 immunoglobulin-like domain-containing protein [Kineococcus radiotolerans]ABS04865.1 hypothetical protein Krad_3401 [Kineococcus radiotolerans SRS30216 = ATCC BAA-149]